MINLFYSDHGDISTEITPGLSETTNRHDQHVIMEIFFRNNYTVVMGETAD